MTSPDRTLRILLVEDHVATASALARTLLRHGFAVAPANTARAALEVARLQSFDLLITDIGLPEKNGWELFRELRKLQPGLVAMAVTGYAYARDVQRSTDLGIPVHLVKPATIQQVLTAIAQLFPDRVPDSARRFVAAEPLATAPDRRVDRRTFELLYLEDDVHDVELLQLACKQNEPDCVVTAAMSRADFIASLQSGRFDGILSDSGVHDLFGAEAVQLARGLTPALPYVFLCGVMNETKRMELLAARPDGIFSKDEPADTGRAIALLRSLRGR
jgi:CheY-like chemotaxis protein